MSRLNTGKILGRLVSHCQATGYFDVVAGHEPKGGGPGHGFAAGVWMDRIEPSEEDSGLNVVSVRSVAQIQIETNMLASPQDKIDPNLGDAVDAVLDRIIGDITLGGTVRNVDIFGETGQGLNMQAGYLERDRKLYRVVTVNVPCVVSNVWEIKR